MDARLGLATNAAPSVGPGPPVLSDVSVGLATNRTRYVSHAQGQHQKCGQTIVGRVVNRSGYAFIAVRYSGRPRYPPGTCVM